MHSAVLRNTGMFIPRNIVPLSHSLTPQINSERASNDLQNLLIFQEFYGASQMLALKNVLNLQAQQQTLRPISSNNSIRTNEAQHHRAVSYASLSSDNQLSNAQTKFHEFNSYP